MILYDHDKYWTIALELTRNALFIRKMNLIGWILIKNDIKTKLLNGGSGVLLKQNPILFACLNFVKEVQIPTYSKCKSHSMTIL